MKKTKKSPRIYRSFTEGSIKFFKKQNKILKKLKFQASIFLLGFLITTLLLLAVDVLFVFQKQKEIYFEKAKLNSEIRLWENIVQKYPSKDTYFRLARLEYRVGDLDKSKYYTDKALYMDPNFKEAQEFKKILIRELSS